MNAYGLSDEEIKRIAARLTPDGIAVLQEALVRIDELRGELAEMRKELASIRRDAGAAKRVTA